MGRAGMELCDGTAQRVSWATMLEPAGDAAGGACTRIVSRYTDGGMLRAVRQASLNQERIPPDVHREWFGTFAPGSVPCVADCRRRSERSGVLRDTLERWRGEGVDLLAQEHRAGGVRRAVLAAAEMAEQREPGGASSAGNDS